jgi:metallo-beta-lactamase class B
MSRLKPFAILLFCMLCLAACARANAGATSAGAGVQYAKAPVEWNQPLKPFRVIGNVYYVGSSGMSAFLVTTPKGAMLLNGGAPETAPLVLKSIEQLGFRPGDVKLIVGMHGHYDHVGALAALKKATGARVLGSALDAALIERGGAGDFQYGDALPYPPVKVDRRLRDGETVELGGAVLTAILTPGHTQGSMTLAMTAQDGVKPYRVVFAGSISSPSYVLVGNKQYPAIVQDYERTFKTLKALPCDVLLGEHGFYFDLDAKLKRLAENPKSNPFIDPTGLQRYVQNAEKQFRALLKKQQSASKSASAAGAASTSPK